MSKQKNNKIVIVVIAALLVLVIIGVVFFLRSSSVGKTNNDIVVLEVKDKTGKVYNDGLVVNANSTIEIEATIKNENKSEVYNYGLYYGVIEGENHGIVIGEVSIEGDIKTEGSISEDNIVVPITITNVGNENKKVKLGVKYSKIAITYEDKENKIGKFNNDVPNEPNLVKGMIPINYNEFKKVWEKADYSNWYDYENKKWANAVMVSEETRDNYIKASTGTEVKEDDILSYFVWIPRYRYKLFNTSFQTIEPSEIEIIFEVNSYTKSVGAKDGEWLTHPAFTFGDTELSGIWVGKFETTGTSDAPTIKPNQVSLTNQNVSLQFETSRKINYVLKSEVSKIDSHIAKNIDWGAVVYLSHSKYGTCVDGVCKNVRNNNVNTMIDKNGPSITGCASTMVDGAMIVSDTCDTNSSKPYNDNQIGVLASTTHSIYGIYDMAGGSWETVMGVMKTEDGNDIISGVDDEWNSGYSGILDDDGKIKRIQGKALPDGKYYDVYVYNTDYTSKDKTHLGDATGETNRWNDDFAEFLENPISWFMRGGLYNHQSFDGIFAYGGANGRISIIRSFRTVIVNVEKGN